MLEIDKHYRFYHSPDTSPITGKLESVANLPKVGSPNETYLIVNVETEEGMQHILFDNVFSWHELAA